MKKIIRFAICQETGSADPQVSVEKNIQALKIAHAQKVDLILFSELHAHLYFCQKESTAPFSLAQTIPGEMTHLFCQLAKEYHIVIVSSLFEERAPGLYHNTAIVYEKTGEIAGIYRKMHIPDDPGYYEKYYFAPGDLGFHPIPTSLGNLGVLVCWDQWYPEAARIMTLHGADLLLYPSAIGCPPKENPKEKERQKSAWITIQRAHAIANGLPLLSCNRVGFEANPEDQQAGLIFWGSSFACDQMGEILVQASDKAPALLIGEIDLEKTRQTRQNWPYLRDRRIDAYQDLLKRYI